MNFNVIYDNKRDHALVYAQLAQVAQKIAQEQARREETTRWWRRRRRYVKVLERLGGLMLSNYRPAVRAKDEFDGQKNRLKKKLAQQWDVIQEQTQSLTKRQHSITELDERLRFLKQANRRLDDRDREIVAAVIYDLRRVDPALVRGIHAGDEVAQILAQEISQRTRTKTALEQRIDDQQSELTSLRQTEHTLAQELADVKTLMSKQRRQWSNQLTTLRRSSKNIAALISDLQNPNDLIYQRDWINTRLRHVRAQADELSLSVDLPPINDVQPRPQVLNTYFEEVQRLRAQIRSMYPMKSYANSDLIVRRLSHDISEDRGQTAFNRRAEGLIQATNIALDDFNKKFWQITGQRWESQGKGYGYTTVAPTHDPLDHVSL